MPSPTEAELRVLGRGLRLAYPAPIDPLFDGLLHAIDRADDERPENDAFVLE